MSPVDGQRCRKAITEMLAAPKRNLRDQISPTTNMLALMTKMQQEWKCRRQETQCLAATTTVFGSNGHSVWQQRPQCLAAATVMRWQGGYGGELDDVWVLSRDEQGRFSWRELRVGTRLFFFSRCAGWRGWDGV